MKGEDDADEVRCLDYTWGMGFKSSFDSADNRRRISSIIAMLVTRI